MGDLAPPTADQPSGLVARARGLGRRRWSRRLKPYLFILPAASFMAVFVVYPVYYALRLSLYDYRLGAESSARPVGWGNYETMLGDERLFGSLVRTAVYVAGAVSLSVVLGLALALLVWKLGSGAEAVWRPALLLPVLASPVIIGLVWKWLLDPTYGLINYGLGRIGMEGPVWLGSSGLALATVIGVDVWQFTPFAFLTLLAGLKSLDLETLDAARVDGATGWSLLRHLIVPLLKPLIIVVVLLRVFMALRTFDMIYVLTGGGPGRSTEVLNMYVYSVGFGFFRMGYGSALTVVVVALSFAGALVLMRVMRPDFNRHA